MTNVQLAADLRPAADKPHDAKCLGHAMICAVENLRDYAISADRDLIEVVLAEKSILGIALGYLNDGICDCICEPGDESSTSWPTMRDVKPVKVSKATWKMSRRELAQVFAEHFGWKGTGGGWIHDDRGLSVAQGWDELGNKLAAKGWIEAGVGVHWIRIERDVQASGATQPRLRRTGR